MNSRALVILLVSIFLSACASQNKPESKEEASQRLVAESSAESVAGGAVVSSAGAYVAMNAVNSQTGLPISQGSKTAVLIGTGLVATHVMINQLGKTKTIDATNVCEGVSGSVIKPLKANKGLVGVVEDIGGFLGLSSSSKDSENKEQDAKTDSDKEGLSKIVDLSKEKKIISLKLKNLNRHFVPQADRKAETNELCWAAALETSRSFMKLHTVSQQSLPKLIQKECPAPDGEKTASAYQIQRAAKILAQKYDKDKVKLHWCDEEPCIVDSLERNRPLIVGFSEPAEHAVILVGIDYTKTKLEKSNDYAVSIKNYHYLDPMEDNAKKALKTVNSDEMADQALFILAF